MNGLPRIVQRAPLFFYVAAILYFIGSIALTHLQLANALEAAGGSAGAMDSYSRLALFTAWLQALESSLYLAANGVAAHILLAIWRNTRRPEPPESGE
ncbi:MAG TPA: hypothetical protein VEX35_05900 [Allosphingosinicella sp.]|nr:hypothetical protein [Allosphingosinicella sp.]